MSFRIPYCGAGIAFIKEDLADKDNFFIFMGKRSMPPFNRTWSIPGGSLEKKLSENTIDGAKREFTEESGIPPLLFMNTYLGKWVKKFPLFSWTTFFYLTTASFEDAVPCEFSVLRWVSFKELKNYRCRPFTREEMQCGKELLKNRR